MYSGIFFARACYSFKINTTLFTFHKIGKNVDNDNTKDWLAGTCHEGTRETNTHYVINLKRNERVGKNNKFLQSKK